MKHSAAPLTPSPGRSVIGRACVSALLALGVHFFRLRTQYSKGYLSGWGYRFARGAAAIAMSAVVFSALPSLVFLP